MEQMQDVRQVSETKGLLPPLLPLPLPPPAPLHRGARLSPLGAPAGLPVTARARTTQNSRGMSRGGSAHTH